MRLSGSGGLGAVSLGLGEMLLLVVGGILVIGVMVKIAKLVIAAMKG